LNPLKKLQKSFYKNGKKVTHKNRVADPDSIGSVDPDPDSESGSGSRRAKMTHKSRQKFVKVHVFKCWMASFES
jgi:hypothetical protein